MESIRKRYFRMDQIILGKFNMIDLLKFVKSSNVIGAVKRFFPKSIQNSLFSFSMARNKNLLRKIVLEYLTLRGGGGI
jgi:hypothetical protein